MMSFYGAAGSISDFESGGREFNPHWNGYFFLNLTL